MITRQEGDLHYRKMYNDYISYFKNPHEEIISKKDNRNVIEMSGGWIFDENHYFTEAEFIAFNESIPYVSTLFYLATNNNYIDNSSNFYGSINLEDYLDNDFWGNFDFIDSSISDFMNVINKFCKEGFISILENQNGVLKYVFHFNTVKSFINKLIDIYEFDLTFNEIKINKRKPFSLDIRKRCYEKSNGCCAYCGKELGNSFEIDHIIPLSKGGNNSESNLVAACQSCNRLKHNSNINTFKSILAKKNNKSYSDFRFYIEEINENYLYK